MKSLIILCSLLALSNGFILDLFNRIMGTGSQCSNATSFKDPLIARDPKCEAKADTGDCSFYDCFEDRYPCGTCGFPKTYGLYNCEKMQMPLYLDAFNVRGQRFVMDAGRCLTLHMRTLYSLDRLSCEVIKNQMEEKVSDCFIASGFCDILMENRNALWSVYNVKKFIKNPTLIGEVMEIAKNCSEQIATWAFGQAQLSLTETQTNNGQIGFNVGQLMNTLGKK